MGVTASGIAYKEIGDGPPLLLVNGYAATKDDWDPNFLSGLSAKFRVICPDNRGVGESPRGDGPLSIASMAVDMVGLLDDLDLESVHLAGWSMGGFIAQTMVACEPERFESLVILGSDPGGIGADRRAPEIEARLTDTSGSPEEQAKRLIDLLFPPGFAARVWEAAGAIVTEARAALDPRVLAEQETAMNDWYEHADPPIAKISEHATAVVVPVLIAHGLEDRIIPARNSRVLSGALQNAWLAPFPGCGHAFMAQQPERLSRLIAVFLDR